jgi:hypothetical protein
VAWRQRWVAIGVHDLDDYIFAEDDGGFGRMKVGVALTLDLALKRLEGFILPMFLIRLDSVLRDW